MESHKKPDENLVPHYEDFEILNANDFPDALIKHAHMPKQRLYYENINIVVPTKFIDRDRVNVSCAIGHDMFMVRSIKITSKVKPWQTIGFDITGGETGITKHATEYYPFFSNPQNVTTPQIIEALEKIQKQRHPWMNSRGHFNAEIKAKLTKTKNSEEAKLCLVENFCSLMNEEHQLILFCLLAAMSVDIPAYYLQLEHFKKSSECLNVIFPREMSSVVLSYLFSPPSQPQTEI